MTRRRKWWWAFGAVSGAFFSSVVLSCGASALTTRDLESSFDSLKAQPQSNASRIVWEGEPIFDQARLAALGYALPEYSTKLFADVNAAASDTTSDWTPTLPTWVSSNPSERALWVRFPSLDLTQRFPFAINLTFQVGLLLLP